MAAEELVITNIRTPGTIWFLKALSQLLGWIYFLAWSISFYPQPWMNFRRQSTIGTTPAYPIFNVLGFACYSVSTTLLYTSPLIRSQYRERHNGVPNTVAGNDVAFAMHALLLSVITLSQFWTRLWGFERRVPFVKLVGCGVWGLLTGAMVAIASVVVLVLVRGKDGGSDATSWAWIDVVNAVGYIKLLVTCVKYTPQAWKNYKAKSTAGWSITQILLDFLGGVLSIAQLVIDSSLQSDWSGITGNPVKLGLGQVSIFFDIIFMVQHYILYRGKGKGSDGEDDGKDDERRDLLGSDEEAASR
ncbi:hypothetical protein N7G274_005854 [Stereocaulon virgatum]|uniref:Cystinosin n=1 Tax=Stereocaulon virgatum TaxID=373712 RepID=A0ABR4A6D4_9LECA